MKSLRYFLTGLAALSLPCAYGQDRPATGGTGKTETHEEAPSGSPPAAKLAEPRLTRFNLDFPGGTPKELVEAIQKATGRPLNAVIPVEYATWKLPPLKMNGVTVAQLFQAMAQASHSIAAVPGANGSYSVNQIKFGFEQSEGRPTDDTIWYFNVSAPLALPKVTRFYYLGPYLDAGLTVDDITTAIQTGWRLRGDGTPAALSFHKETKLLIAVGDYTGLEVIEQVLKALDAVKGRPAVDKPAIEPKPKS